jgi:two-component system NtrC family sensor kinase
MGSPLKRLAPRLIVALTLLVAIAAGITGYICARAQETQLLEETIRRADQLSRSITSATWHAMLADHRQDAYEVMSTMGEQQGIMRIQMIDKEGRVAFSSDPEGAKRVEKDSEACVMCHVGADPLVRVEASERARIVRDDGGHRRLDIVTAIYNEPSCSTAACHAHSPDASMLGVLDLTLDLSPLDGKLDEMRTRRMLLSLGEVVVVALFIAVFTMRFVSKPITKLIAGTKAVSAMELDNPIDIDSTTELGELAGSFNVMRERLKSALDELSELTRNLERKVEVRTRQLRITQERLVRSDRMASLGRLAASVAHEINNPLSAILNLSMVMERVLTEDGIPPGRELEFRDFLSRISEETARVGGIVKDLLTFSRSSTPKRADADLNEIVKKTLSLISHKLELGNVIMTLKLDENLPLVPCDASQIQQVVVNLVMNAAEAMPGGGEAVVRTRLEPEADSVVLEVADTGTGVSNEDLARIFDPFFTTKEEGKGVGLGLAVAYGMVNAHGGTIEVESFHDQGTVFGVHLPLNPDAAGDSDGGNS